MKKPDAEAILCPLKPFQRRTVDHAFHRLFIANDSTARFLVADEVGLGKTLVARGVIARAVDHLWPNVKHIDIIYICSNASIARANLPKLEIGNCEGNSFSLATRLTMLATQLAAGEKATPGARRRLNFVSFTPGTSFNLSGGSGHQAERRVLFHLLAPLLGSSKRLMNVLQGGIGDYRRWRQSLNDKIPIHRGIRRDFVKAWKRSPELEARYASFSQRWFSRPNSDLSPEARRIRNQWVGEVRRLLAAICVAALEPDLVIMDEFQRFKSLLNEEEGADPAAQLAQSLFQATTPEGQPVRTLLLSATPYKLFTSEAEIDQDDHYVDFINTTRFLMGQEETASIDALRNDLQVFGQALKRSLVDDGAAVIEAKTSVEQRLTRVMARTERVSESEDHNAMVNERRTNLCPTPADIEQYMAADAIFQAVGAQDPMPFWKAAPYLFHFMHGYRMNDHLDEAVELEADALLEALQKHQHALLSPGQISTWNSIGDAHAKLREMRQLIVNNGAWKRLWIAATAPYWPLQGAFHGAEEDSKTLLFSAWNVVPDVVSALLSYETERLMVGGRMASYQNPTRQQSALLRLSKDKEGELSRHRLFLLLMPCLTLADKVHPLAAPLGCDVRTWARELVEELLAGLPDPQTGPVDERWEWAAPVLLDPGLSAFLRKWQRNRALKRPNGSVFGAYVREIAGIKAEELGQRPPGLVDLLVDVALGSPAIIASRCLAMTPINDSARRLHSSFVAQAFWSLFNGPAVISLLIALFHDQIDGQGDVPYWRMVLQYCIDGNLQAVLDEQWHILWEQQSWRDEEEPLRAVETCVEDLVYTVAKDRSTRVHAQFFSTTKRSPGIRTREIRIRTDFALRFANLQTDDEGMSQDKVRASFNSPFRPFLLASTSIGQEGLDFHPWCHRLTHWNLPGNPVDLEQREGRVHRYKGLAVRKNVAARHANAARKIWQPGDDLWTIIFDLATQEARQAGAEDLRPFWLAPGPARVERHVPLLSYSQEEGAFARLKRQLAAYRVVFGQPRQEELLELLDRSSFSTQVLKSWVIDLSPPDVD